ncbi:MAG TPA: sigma-70 family RNA polymerase sigma factor [Polyangiaceae bacterium]
MGKPALPAVTGLPPDREEFASLYHREFSYVWHTLRRLGVPQRELFDVTQNVFIVLYHRLHLYDSSRPLRPWIFGVAFRVTADYLRLARHSRESARADIETIDGAPSADELLALHEEQMIVREALAAVDLERRAVVVAHDFDGVPGPEIADALGIPLKTMYYRLRTGRGQFVAAVRRIQARLRDR